MTTRERFVTVEETAEYLGKPPSWIYNNAERLRLPRYRVGNQWRFRLSEVDEWVRAGAGVSA